MASRTWGARAEEWTDSRTRRPDVTCWPKPGRRRTIAGVDQTKTAYEIQLVDIPDSACCRNLPSILAFEQASHGGEIAAAGEAGVVTRDRVTDLGRVLSGEAGGRRSARDITLFDSTGLAIQDLAIAKVAAAEADGMDLQRLEF